MKLVTRYLLGHLRRPWLYVLAGFSTVAILVDLFDSFVDFMDAGTSLRQILLYYAILLPTFMPFLLPISMLLALLYALWQLGKNSELTAMRASGLSLTQLITPYLLTGLAASLFLLAVNEGFNPWATHWVRQFKHLQSTGESAFLRPVAYMHAAGLRDWRIDFFDVRPASSYEMRTIKLTQQRPDKTIEYEMKADRGRWLDGHWWLENVVTRFYDANNEPSGPVESLPSAEMVELTETPRDFIDSLKAEDERSAADIRRYLHNDVSKEYRDRLMVNYHYRLASPWLCIIVVLVGVPFGMHTGRQGMGLGILLALLTFFGYYVLMLLGLAWGKSGLIPPVLAGWAPGLVFLTLGTVMLHRIR